MTFSMQDGKLIEIIQLLKIIAAAYGVEMFVVTIACINFVMYSVVVITKLVLFFVRQRRPKMSTVKGSSGSAVSKGVQSR